MLGRPYCLYCVCGICFTKGNSYINLVQHDLHKAYRILYSFSFQENLGPKQFCSLSIIEYGTEASQDIKTVARILQHDPLKLTETNLFYVER
jgi:hypothetical protein